MLKVLCLACNEWQTIPDDYDKPGCPGCGDTGIGALEEDIVTIKITWHELRVLVMWAEKFSLRQGRSKIVYGIADRIILQHPERIPLTLAGEIAQLKEMFGEKNVETNFPDMGKEDQQ